MRQIITLTVFLLASLHGYSQNGDNALFDVIEYMPAPGQHINIKTIGTPDAAGALAISPDSLVSLGSFGGYLILGFKENCLNHPDNPYGIDFTLFGNAFAGSSEPGVIWVMKDENGNGLPDDVWYEIAGSHYFHSGTVRDYEVTYLKTASRDVLWYDNKNGSGMIKANEFNLQDYYPSPEYFPDYPPDSVTFSGTLLGGSVDSTNVTEIITTPPVFGYADCRPLKQGISLKLPDNPYTSSVEGAGGDPVDISWAVDSDGNYVDLDYINFVKVVSGNMASAGWLGEISTDISFAEDVDPNAAVTGKENILVVYPHSDRIIAGGQMKVEACWFENGRKQNREISYSSDDTNILTVDNEGLISAGNSGSAQINISVFDELSASVINVVVPGTIEIKSDLSALFPGDTVLLSAEVFDNLGALLDIPVIFEAADTIAGKVFKSGNRYFFNAIRPGETIVRCFVENFSVEQYLTFNVRPSDINMKVYMSVKTEDENLLPFQWIETGYTDLNQVVRERNNDYSGIDKLTLFHALAAGLKKAGVNFDFLDDEHSGGSLYLYSVENDGLFTYGWGGKTDPEIFARAWIARLNDSHYLNSFDEIAISEGDTIDLYNVYNITNPWYYKRLLASEDSASVNEEIEVLLEQAECKFENGLIAESAFSPVANGEIIAGSSFYTGDDGTALFLTGSSLPLIVSSGNNAVLILKRVTTGVTTPSGSSNSFTVYPNPFNNVLTVKGNGAAGFTILLSGETGRIFINERSFSSLYNLNAGDLVSGSYILVIIGEEGMETFKLIKK